MLFWLPCCTCHFPVASCQTRQQDFSVPATRASCSSFQQQPWLPSSQVSADCPGLPRSPLRPMVRIVSHTVLLYTRVTTKIPTPNTSVLHMRQALQNIMLLNTCNFSWLLGGGAAVGTAVAKPEACTYCYISHCLPHAYTALYVCISTTLHAFPVATENNQRCEYSYLHDKYIFKNTI